MHSVNSILVNIPLLQHLKRSQNRGISDVLRRNKEETLKGNELMSS